jgi:isopenicillin-N epimerase
MASVPLPDSRADHVSSSPLYIDEFQDRLLFQYGIEVPVIPWPAFPKRLLRVCAQLYNETGDYERLAAALRAEGVGSEKREG